MERLLLMGLELLRLISVVDMDYVLSVIRLSWCGVGSPQRIDDEQWASTLRITTKAFASDERTSAIGVFACPYNLRVLPMLLT